MSIEKLRQRLSQIQSNLAEAQKRGLPAPNEADTERLVVEPVLEALGYGPLDYQKRAQGIGADFPDYTVLPLSEKRWCLEVKEWDARLEERAQRQCVNYANNNGAQWAVLTNGRIWWIYNTRAPGNLREMRAYAVDDIFDLKAASDVLTRMSRESVEGGELDREYRSREIRSAVLAFLRSGDRSLVRAIQRGVAEQLDRHITPEDVEDALNTVLSMEQPQPAVPHPKKKPAEGPPSPPSGDFLTLPELVAQLKSTTGIKPATARLPSGEELEVESWRDLAEQVVAYLLGQGKVPDLPFTGTEAGANSFLDTEPVHTDGHPMRAYRKLDTANGPVYMDTHRSAVNIMERVKVLCETVGQAPESVMVKISEEPAASD